MHKFVILLAAGLVATPSLAAPIDGTWVADIASTQLSAKPKVRALINGTYRCVTCVPAYAIPADGGFHAIKGSPYGAEQSVKVVDARTVAFETKEKGRPVGTNTATVTPDGKTITWSWTNINPNGLVTTGEQTDIRIAPGARGSHAISGSWRNGKMVAMDPKAATVTFRQDGNILRMSTPTGEGYDAPIGGRPVPIRGDTAGTMASVRKAAPNSWVESNWRKGKLVAVVTMRALNPTTLAVVSQNKLNGRVMRYTAKKQ